jgi:cysteine desulfurase/selenocysteine lyase
VFSGHKVFGPTGIGVLYGRAEVLEAMPPWQGGGNMISSVTFEKTTYQRPPARFEAGTGNIADAAGLAAALEYISRIGMPLIDRYEHDLLTYATASLQTVPGLHLIGTAQEKASVLSFVLDGHDSVAVGSALNEEGIAVRAGHHCAEPILRRFGVTMTVRPSLAFYNTCEEVDTLTIALRRLTGHSGRR